MAPDLICMGEPLREFTEISNKEGENVYLPGFGGDISNCAIAAARQGLRVGLITALGDDRFGDDFMALWHSEGIDVSRVQRSANTPTGAYFVHPKPDGRDFTYLRKGSAASQIKAEDVTDNYMTRAKVFFTSAISQAISADARRAVFHAIEVARSCGLQVAYDTNLRLQLWPLELARQTIHQTAGLCHVLLPSLDESMQLTGLCDPVEIADFYLQLGPEVVALKLGSRGSLVVTRERREFIPPVPVVAVDATAAGDTFDGAFLAEYTLHGNPYHAAQYANTAAALTTASLGAVSSIPGRSQVIGLQKRCE